MRFSVLLPLCSAALTAAAQNPQAVLQDPQTTLVEPDEYIIELAPGKTRRVTEDEKWALRRVRI